MDSYSTAGRFFSSILTWNIWNDHIAFKQLLNSWVQTWMHNRKSPFYHNLFQWSCSWQGFQHALTSVDYVLEKNVVSSCPPLNLEQSELITWDVPRIIRTYQPPKNQFSWFSCVEPNLDYRTKLVQVTKEWNQETLGRLGLKERGWLSVTTHLLLTSRRVGPQKSFLVDIGYIDTIF